MPHRDAVLDDLARETFDVLIVGGGINGAASAAALSHRGAKVALIDRSDFASLTSQESSNLVWGGIKYMEQLELSLVRKLCRSRNRLLAAYPSSVREIRFYAVHDRGFRHSLWKLLLGTLLYWILGGFFTRRPRRLTQATMAEEEPVLDISRSDGGFEYSDAYLPDTDARFVWGFVRAALDSGATALNYVESLGSERRNGVWETPVHDVISGRRLTIRSRILVNACGPYVDAHNQRTHQQTSTHHVFSKGIHLIVDRITKSEHVLTLFADDGRPFFVIPMGHRTAIGTTDTRVDSPDARVTAEDRAFVLSNINRRLRLEHPLTEADIIAERCGVRPLAVRGDDGLGDFLQLSRRHVLEVNAEDAHVSVFGGKLTDCLNIGEEMVRAIRRLGVALARPRGIWYGEPEESIRERARERAREIGLESDPLQDDPPSNVLYRRHGARCLELLDAMARDARLAEPVLSAYGERFYRAELELMAEREGIVKLEDFLRRRTKIALVATPAAIAELPGLREACAILFGSEAEEKLIEYRKEHGLEAPVAVVETP